MGVRRDSRTTPACSGTTASAPRIWFTFKFSILATVLTNVVALAIAVGLNAKIKGRNVLRGVYFIPNILTILIVGYIFQYLFANSLPRIGESLGIDSLSTNILADPELAWLGIVVVAVWQAAAFAIILYLAGLQTVPDDVYEAAAIDGARGVEEVLEHHVPAHRAVLHDQHGVVVQGLPAGVRPHRRDDQRRAGHVDRVDCAADLPRRF